MATNAIIRCGLHSEVMIFDPIKHKVVGQHLSSNEQVAVLSIDVEYDYGHVRTDALDRLPDLLAVVRSAELPLTAFVEGRLFDERPAVCARLVEAGADVQLHCYDHQRPGDTADSLRRGIDAYERFCGARPSGYRAHTCRLTEPLFARLVAEGFTWDSSILPGFGLGSHQSPAWKTGDWFNIDGALLEFPVASWRKLRLPFTHIYRQLMGRSVEALLSCVTALPTLLVYNMHMVDLVRDGRIATLPGPMWLKSLHWLARRRGKGLDSLPHLVESLREKGYEWTTLTQCHDRLAGVSAKHAPGAAWSPARAAATR